MLVEAGANVEILEDISAATPLHFAASNGSIPVAKVVLEAGAYVNAVDDSHMTPLHYVVVPEVTDMGKLTVLMVYNSAYTGWISVMCVCAVFA